MNNFDSSKRFTVESFSRYVAPTLRKNFDGVEIYDTESFNDPKSKYLDRENCIDGYILTANGEIQYFGSRIQKNFYPTFTIRKSRDTGNVSEFERLCNLINSGKIYPKWTIQSYITDKKVIIAVVDTKQLIKFILKNNPPVRHTRSNQFGQAEFYICNWTALKNFGADVYIFEKSK